MKRLTRSIIAIFAITTTLVSCSKDDNNASNDNAIVGKWMVENAVVTAPNTAPQTVDLDGDCTDKNYFDIKTAGIMEAGSVDPENNCEFTSSDGTWKKNNDTMEMEIDGEKNIWKIKSVSASKLVLNLTSSGGETLPAGYSIDFNFTKK